MIRLMDSPCGLGSYKSQISLKRTYCETYIPSTKGVSLVELDLEFLCHGFYWNYQKLIFELKSTYQKATLSIPSQKPPGLFVWTTQDIDRSDKTRVTFMLCIDCP
jgi:hypothetical protein